MSTLAIVFSCGTCLIIAGNQTALYVTCTERRDQIYQPLEALHNEPQILVNGMHGLHQSHYFHFTESDANARPVSACCHLVIASSWSRRSYQPSFLRFCAAIHTPGPSVTSLLTCAPCLRNRSPSYSDSVT